MKSIRDRLAVLLMLCLLVGRCSGSCRRNG